MVRDPNRKSRENGGAILIEMAERSFAHPEEKTDRTGSGERADGALAAESPDSSCGDLNPAGAGQPEVMAVVPRGNYIAIGILFFVNLLNYMDRFTIAGR